MSMSTALQAKHQLDDEYVYVDAHILCTPAIADIDNDQHDELVVAVSYFYDKEYYDDPSHAHELQNIDKEKYVAGRRRVSVALKVCCMRSLVACAAVINMCACVSCK
jgi:hypothetical protein